MSNTLPKARDGFTSTFGVLAATLGSAVGLGNIWKFPYLTGENGGAGFLLVYVIATLLVGLPVMISEIMLGRQAKSDAVSGLIKLAPKGQPWWLIAAMGVTAAFLIMSFYSEVAAWVFAYIFKAASGEILSTDPAVTGAAFNSLITETLNDLVVTVKTSIHQKLLSNLWTLWKGIEMPFGYTRWYQVITCTFWC